MHFNLLIKTKYDNVPLKCSACSSNLRNTRFFDAIRSLNKHLLFMRVLYQYTSCPYASEIFTSTVSLNLNSIALVKYCTNSQN